MRTRNTSPGVVALLFGITGLLVLLIEQGGLISSQFAFIVLTFVLLLHLGSQVMRVRRMHSERWLLNPAVMCTVVTFMLGFGLTNFLYFLPEDQLARAGVPSGANNWMVQLLALVLLGAIAMWLGYWSSFSAKLGRKFQNSRLLNRLLRTNPDYRVAVLMILVAVSLASRLIAIQLGVFGYSSDGNRLTELAGVTQYLSMTAALGQLALVVVALRYFSPTSRSLTVVYWFWGLLGYEVIAGFLSGFKSQVAMPIVIVGIAMYMRRRSVPWRWVILVPVAISISYTVIEPFRAARLEDRNFDGTSLEYISKTLRRSYIDGSISSSKDESSNPILFLARTNNIKIGSLGIEYADSQLLSESSPDFLSDIFLAPIYAFLPRAIFDFKPLSNLGSWYRTEVQGIIGDSTSIAMGPFTYLYFAGGVIAVACGFFFIGIIQRSMTDVFLNSPKAGAAIPFFIILPVLVQIDSSFYSIIIGFVRNIPIALFLQYIIYRR